MFKVINKDTTAMSTQQRNEEYTPAIFLEIKQ